MRLDYSRKNAVGRLKRHFSKLGICCAFTLGAALFATPAFANPLWDGDTVSVPDGVYEITNVAAHRALDVADGSTDNSANVQSFTSNYTYAQFWRVEAYGAHYRITNVKSDKALQVDGSCASAGTNVNQYDFNEGYNQLWDFVQAPDGAYYLRSADLNYVLDLTNGSLVDGANVQISDYFGGTCQRWRIQKFDIGALDSGCYRFVNSGTGKYLDLDAESSDAGVRVQVKDSNEQLSEIWQLIYEGDDTYTIRNTSSAKYLDVPNSDAHDGAVLHQWDGNDSKAQRWIVKRNLDGQLSIKTALGDYVLSVDGDNLVLKNAGSAPNATWQNFSIANDDPTVGEVNALQQQVLDAVNTVPPSEKGLCASWVSKVFDSLGYGYNAGNSCDMYWAYCKSSNLDDLRPGMIMAVPSHTRSVAGSQWGHVAIYIGNNMVADSIGYLNLTPLTSWLEYYGTTYAPAWGWYGDIPLA